MGIKHLLVMSACLFGLSAQIELLTIIEASTKAIVNGTEKDNSDVLKKHFFTENKGESIWPLVYNATLSTSSYEYGFDELINIERNTMRLAKHLKYCLEIKTKLEKANCLANTLELVKQIVDDTTWHYDDLVVMEDIAKQIHFFVAIRSMMAHALNLVENNLNSIPNFQQRKSHHEKIRDYFKVVLREVTGTRYKETSMPMLEQTWEYAQYWRKDQVSAVEICQQRSLFWKDFPQGCEIRWRRSTDQSEEDEEIKQNHILKNNDYLQEIEKKVEMIGGTLHDNEMVLTATVTDTITGELIYKDRGSTSGTVHKGDVMDGFIKKGNKIRDTYVIKLNQSIKKNFAYVDLFTKAAFEKLSKLQTIMK